MPTNGYKAKIWQAGNVITDDALNTMEEGIEKVVLVSETDPNERYNKIWVSNRGSSVEIPTYNEVGGLIEGLKTVKNLALTSNIIGKLELQRPVPKTITDTTTNTTITTLGLTSNTNNNLTVIIPVREGVTYSININWMNAGSSWCKNREQDPLVIDSDGKVNCESEEYFNYTIPVISSPIDGDISGHGYNYADTENQYFITAPAEAEFLVLTGLLNKWAPGATLETVNDSNFQLIVAETTLPIMGRTKYSYPQDIPAIEIPNLKINNSFVKPIFPYIKTRMSIDSKEALLKCFNFQKFRLTNQEGGKLDFTQTDRFTTPDFCSFTENLTIRSKNSNKKFIYCTKNNDTSVSNSQIGWITEKMMPANTEFIICFQNAGTSTIEEYFNDDIEFIFSDANGNVIEGMESLNEKVAEIQNALNIKDYNIPSYYFTASGNWPGLDQKINQIQAALPAEEEGMAFIFFTDPHFSKNEGHSKELIRYILNKTGIPFVICGGDISNVGGGKTALQDEIEMYQDYIQAFGKEKVLFTRGNHDLYQSYSGYFDSVIRTSQGTFTLTERVKSDKAIVSDNNYHFVLQYNPAVSNDLTLTKITIKYADNTNTEITSNFTGYWESDSNKILSSIDFTGTYSGSTPSANTLNSIFTSIGSYFIEENMNKLFWGDNQYFPKYGTYIVRNKKANTMLLILNTNDRQDNIPINQTMHVSQEQIEWVKSVVEEYKQWKIIAISHIPFNNIFSGRRYSLSNNTYTFIQNWQSNLESTNLVTALKKYQNVLCHISGHAHYDYDITGNQNLVEIVTTTDSLQGEGWYTSNQNAPDSISASESEQYNFIQIQGGTKGTYTEQAFDVCVFNSTTNVLNMFRIGRGNDRTYNLNTGS